MMSLSQKLKTEVAALGIATLLAAGCSSETGNSVVETPFSTPEATAVSSVTQASARSATPTATSIVTSAAIPTAIPTSIAIPSSSTTPTVTPAYTPTVVPTVSPIATPTPLPPPTAIPTPEPNPVEEYAKSFGLSDLVVRNLVSHLGVDNELNDSDRAYIDRLFAVESSEFRVDLSDSFLIRDGVVSLDDLAKVDQAFSYHSLLGRALVNPPGGYNILSDGLDFDELYLLGVVDSSLLRNENFQKSPYGSDNWKSDIRVNSALALVLMMDKIEIFRGSDNVPVVEYVEDDLDRVLDDLGIFPGECVYCFEKGDDGRYTTSEGRTTHYYPLINSEGNHHREMLKSFAYLALANSKDILLENFMEKKPEDFEHLYRRNPGQIYPTTSSLGFQNLTFMTPMKLLDGTEETFMTTVYRIIGNTNDAREAVERLLDYERNDWKHFIGGVPEFKELYHPFFPQNPLYPLPGYVTLVEEGGSPLTIGFNTSAFRSIGLNAQQFLTPREGRRAGSVEIDSHTYYYNGNAPFNRVVKNCPKSASSAILGTLEQVESLQYCKN